MSEYIMPGKDSPEFRSLDEFTQGYIEAALWTSEEQLGEEYTAQGVEPLGAGSVYKPGFSDLAPETVKAMQADCAAFLREHKEQLEIIPRSNMSQHGHDFWLTRNHHGAGFWDRGYVEIGRRLTESCHKFPEMNLYLGDDGKIYIG